MKIGANFNDINEIKRWYSQGKTAAEISSTMGIVLSCVESFAPAAKKPKAKKSEVTKKVNEDGNTQQHTN